MRYCVNARASNKTVNMADEIYIFEPDKAIIVDYVEKYNNKIIILEESDINVDLDLIKSYNDKLNNNFYLVVPIIWPEDLLKQLQERGIKYMFKEIIYDFITLRSAVQKGASAVSLGIPLTHRLIDIKRMYKDLELRTSPNILYGRAYIMPEDRIYANWIRPEDVENYEEYLTTLEIFGKSDFTETSVKIYKINKTWPDLLHYLIPGIDPTIDNRAIPTMAEPRLNCGMRCMEGRACNLCGRLASFSTTIKKIAREKKS